MKELNNYYHGIQKALPCSGYQKQKLMADIRGSVENLLQENPDATFDTVIAHFGTPQQIADTYAAEIPPEELQKKLKIKKWVICITAGIAISAVLIWAGAVGIALATELFDGDVDYIEVSMDTVE